MAQAGFPWATAPSVSRCQCTGVDGPGRPENPYMVQAGFPWATAPGVRARPGFGDFLGRGSRCFFLKVNTGGAVFPHPAEFCTYETSTTQ